MRVRVLPRSPLNNNKDWIEIEPCIYQYIGPMPELKRPTKMINEILTSMIISDK